MLRLDPNRVAVGKRLALAASIALMITGCSGGMSDLDVYIAEVNARPAPPLDPLPVMQQFETFEYAAQDLRDPFSNPDEELNSAAGQGPRPDPERRKEALESFPLDGLDMMGTLGAQEGLVALIMDPDRVIHRVVPGNYMGQNDGRITSVTEDRIELVELVSDGSGGWTERRAEIALDDE
jgi:type IV pilus assembly protein PilP